MKNYTPISFVAAAALALMVALPPASSAAPRGSDTPQNLTDSQIQNAVESELVLDSGVSSHRIDATVNEGIATLSGSVRNILAKDRAVRLAQSIKGVRSVVDQIEVMPASRTDSQIRRDIEDALVSDPTVESFEVAATVLDGAVTLTGTVDSWAEQELAVATAKSVTGVRSVVDAIEVDAKFDRSDAEIQRDVIGRLANDVRVDSSLIVTTVEDGVVKLTGTVGSASEKRTAETVAWTLGAKAVETDNLAVKWWARDEMKRQALFSDINDENIESAVDDAWLYDPRVNAFDLTASSNNGKVTLTGEVDNLAAKWAAGRDARNTNGVWKVTNLIRVRTTEFRADDEVADDIRAALVRDPYVDRYDIDVDVINGRAYLTGKVGTEYELDRAQTLAGMVRGVYHVVNNIETYTPVITLTNDLEIKDQVESELFWSPFVDSDQIEVSVDNGEATLTGSVDTWAEYRNATENAYEGGAVVVDNELIVTLGDS